MPRQLPVPYFPQKNKGYCLAACAQMVLGYWGIVADQDKLAYQLGVEPGVGVPARRIRRLASKSLGVIYESGEWESLQEWLAKGLPVIAAIQAGELSYWQGDYFQHAVVVIGYYETQV
jgi:ABC-type bacteriocin/lantibiotic exporter with double-glycine peptidase domain